MKTVLLATVISGIATQVFATTADEGANTAKGMFIAAVINEKCTGQQPVANQAQRIANALSAQGFEFKDIQRGAMDGIAYAEGSYPIGRRPSIADCREASTMYKAALKIIKNY